MLLQTGEDHEIGLIQHRAAVARDILRTRLLLFWRAAARLTLCHDRSRRGRKQGGNEKCSNHFRPLSDGCAIRTIDAASVNTKRNRIGVFHTLWRSNVAAMVVPAFNDCRV